MLRNTIIRLGSLLALPVAVLTAPGVAEAGRPSTVRCGTAPVRAALGDRVWAAPGEAIARGVLPCEGTPVGPPPNPQIGSSWDWYIWRLNGPPQADLRSCTVRGMGPNCYVVVEDSQWNNNIDQAQVDTIVDHFENTSIGSFPGQGIWDLDTSHFGMPPNSLDQDPRVYILYYDFDVGSDGFFWSFDQQCDNVALYHSNECDVVYMNCSDFDPAGSYLLAVVAHELEHLIHYAHDPNESAWVDEGMGELAMWLYGDPDNISQFNGNPDRQLTSFGGNWYDYIKSYLFSLYFYERYGGQAAVTALVQEPLNSIAGFEEVLDLFAYSENFRDVFSDWVVANYLDDTTLADGRYGYLGDTLPPFSPVVTVSAYPFGPASQSVRHWAADYARYLDGADFHAMFDGSDNNEFVVRAMLLDDTVPTEIVDMTLDGGQAGTLFLPQVGTTHDEVVVVHASISDTGTNAYQYGAAGGPVGAPEIAAGGGPMLRVLDSPSSRPGFAIELVTGAPAGHVRLDLFDVTGRLVRRLVGAAVPDVPRAIVWDGRTDDGATAAPGIYFARLTAAGNRAEARVVLRR